jgi:hypothetical protein
MHAIPQLTIEYIKARPEKDLVRRPHVDQHGCPSNKGKASELTTSYKEQNLIQNSQNDLPAIFIRLIVLRTVFINLLPIQDPGSRFF